MGKLDIKIKAPDPNGAIDSVFGGIEKKVDDRAKKSINNINNTLGKYENEVSNLINGIQIKNNKIQKIDLSDYLQLDASGLYKNAQKQTEIKRDVNKVVEYIVTETNKTFEKSVKSTGKISNNAFNELISNIAVSDDEIDKLLKVSGNNNIDKAIAKKALQAQKLIEQLESSIGISWGKNGFDTTKIGTGLGFDLDAIENEINSLVSLGKTYTGLLGLVKNSNLKLSGYSTNKLNMRSNALQSSSEAGGKYWNEILTNMARGALNPVSEFINSDHSNVGKTSQARDKLMSRFGSIFEESFKNMTRDAKEFDLELDTITEKLNTLSKSALSGNRNKWTTKAKEDFSGFLASYIAKGGNVETDEFKTWSGIRDSLFNTKITPRNKTNIENYKAIYGGVLQYYEKQIQVAEKSAEAIKQAEEKKKNAIKETAKTQREEPSDELLEKNKQFEEYFEKFKKDYRLTKDKQTGDWVSKDGRFRLELLDSSRENRHYGLYDTKEKVERSFQTPGTEPVAYPISLDEGRRNIASILLEESEAAKKTANDVEQSEQHKQEAVRETTEVIKEETKAQENAAVVVEENVEKQNNAVNKHISKLDELKNRSEITFNKKKTSEGIYTSGIDGIYAKKEGRSYSVFDDKNTKILQGLKTLADVEQQTRAYYQNAYNNASQNAQQQINDLHQVAQAEGERVDASEQSVDAVVKSEQQKQDVVNQTTEVIKEQAKVQEEANQKTTLEQLAPEPTKKSLQEIEEKENQLKKEAEEARKVEEEARRQAEEEAKRAEEIKKKAEEERLKAEEEKKRAEEEKAKAEAETARKEAEEKKRQAEEEQRKAEEEKKKAEEAKRKAEEEAKKAEEEAARKAKIEAEREARKAKMEPLPDDDIVKHSYGESGASTTVYSPHLGKTVTKNTTSEGDSFYGTQMNYQELEKRAIAVSNELEVVRANIRIEQEKGVSSSEKRIANLQQEESILQQNLEYVRAIAEAEAENDDDVENPGYTIEQFDRNVQDGTELFSAKLATKTDKEIESIQRANERFHTKVQAFVAKNNAYLAKIDPIYQRDQAFSDVQNAVNSFSPINEDDYKKAELEIKNKINILERIMGLARSNLKGSNTLSTEKSAEYRLSDAPDDINEIVNGYIKLGLTAEEAENKVAGLRDTVTDINNRNNNKGGPTGDLGWTGAEDYSKAVGDLLNNIRIARNEQVKYKNDIKAVREEEKKATSALEKYLSAQEKVESGKDPTGKYAQQAKNQIAIYEQAIKTRAEYIKQNNIIDGIDSEWVKKQEDYKKTREDSISKMVAESKTKAEEEAAKKAEEQNKQKDNTQPAKPEKIQEVDNFNKKIKQAEQALLDLRNLSTKSIEGDNILSQLDKASDKAINKLQDAKNALTDIISGIMSGDSKASAKDVDNAVKAISDLENRYQKELSDINLGSAINIPEQLSGLQDALDKYFVDVMNPDQDVVAQAKQNLKQVIDSVYNIKPFLEKTVGKNNTEAFFKSIWGNISSQTEQVGNSIIANTVTQIQNAIDSLEQFGESGDEAKIKLNALIDVVKHLGDSGYKNKNGLFGTLNNISDFAKNNITDRVIKEQYASSANAWLDNNKANRFDDIKFLVGSQNAVKGALADVEKLDQKLREGSVSTTKYASEYEKLQRKWSNAIASFSYNPSDNREAMKQWINMQAQGSAVTLKWSKDGQQLTGVFRNQNNELVKVVATADQFKGTVKGVVQEIKPMKSGIEAFFDSIGSKWQEVMRYMATYVSLRSVWTEFQKGINVVREYDKALTEMNKVSDASMYTLQAFQKESFGIADSVGVTASVVQNSTADWLRLGESFAQAKESAKASAILYNVSEFQDIGSATDALVSASQAYQELSKTDIIDKINYIGNNYSIATDGLASALQRSAAVLKTQGNNLDQAIALITAGNSIIQNPEMVAAGIRTISLRIAGTEAAKNQLVEAGEDVDDFIIQTKSKTQQLIKDYTAVASNSYKGVDVLDDNGNLRSTYDILLDISKVYKEIQKTDKEAGTNRANALVEALAGKNRSNIAASILSAPEMLENVYRDSAYMSEGSANEELNKQLESIEGHVNRLKNTYDELWTSAINRDAINFFIDMANGALTLVNNIGLVKTAIAGVLSAMEFQSTMSGGGLLFGKTGLISNLISRDNRTKENQFKDLDIKALEKYNDAYDELDDKSEAYRRATKDTNKVTKDFLHNQEGLVDIVNAQKLKDGKGDGFSAILENGKELAKGVAASVGTAIVAYAAEWAIGEIWKQVDQKVIHAHEYAVDKLNNAQSAVDTDNNEISAIDEQLKTIDAEIRNINSLGGASLAKEGELQRLEDQKKELEAQKELKQAILEMDMLELYSAAEKNAGTKVTGYEFASRGGSSYVEQQWIETEQSQQDAIRNTMKYYDYAVKQREQARSEYVRLEKEDAEGNKKRLSELKQQEEDWGKKAVEVRGKVAKMTADMDVTATTLSNWEKLGHTLDETQQDYINAAQEGKDFAIATKDLGIAATDASNSQRDFSHSCVQTSAQLTEQKASVDNLKTSYQEIFSLLSSFTGTDIVLDDAQLQKYAYALEYINGVYTLNKEKLLDVAKANNAVEKSNLEEVRRTERMQLLDNIDEIEIYNQKLQEGQKIYNGIDIQDYISQLQAENQQILSNCKVYDYQISQIDNMTSAYQRWLDTGNVSKDSKQFTDVQSSAKNLEELINTGYFNSEAASHEIDFIIPEDVSRNDKSAILKLAKEYNEYFADGIKGTNKFVQKAMKETLENGTPLIKQLEDGNYEFGEGVTVQDFMDKFGWSESAIRAMLQELHEAQGWNIDWSLENLDTLEDKVVHSQQVISDYESQIKELEDTKKTRTLTDEESKKLDELKEKLGEVKREYAEMRDEFSKQLTSNIRDTIEENGGAQTISEGIPEDASDKEISDYLKGKTGVKSEYEVKVYTEDAQKNIEDLETKYKELEKLYNDPNTQLSYKATLGKQMGEIEAEMDSEKLNLSLLSMLEFDSDGISTESTTQNILNLVGSIDGTLGRIANKVAPQPINGDGAPNTKPKSKPLSSHATVVEGTEYLPTHINPNSIIDKKLLEGKIKLDTTDIDAARKEFEKLNAEQTKTTGVKSSTVTVNGIEYTLEKYRELYKLIQLVSGGRDYTSDTVKLGGRSARAKGNAFARGSDVVGEQGRELVVDPNKGIWYTVGDSGTEMIDLPKDAIVYSHNQTEALLKSGVTTRGKSKGRSFAEGTKYYPTPEEMKKYIWGNIDLQHRQPYFYTDEDGWDHVNTVLGAHKVSRGLHFALAGLAQGDEVYQIDDGALQWYADQLTAQSTDPNTILGLDKQGFTDDAGNWLHDLVAYVGTNAEEAERISQIMHVISDEYERSIGTYARGNAFANGTLVGERGRELVVDPNSGRWYTVGDYGSEMIDLPKDAIVYNHQQTEDLLKNGHTGRGHSTGASFAEGNAYAEGPISGGGGLETSNTGSKDKQTKAAADAAKSAEKAAKSAKKSADEAKQTIDWIERAIEVQNRALKKQKDIYEDEYEGYDTRLTAVDQYREQLEEKLNVLTEALDRRNEKMFENEQELIKQIGDQDKEEVILKRVLEGDVDPGEWLEDFQKEFGAEGGQKVYDIVVKLQTNQKEIEDLEDQINEVEKDDTDAQQEAFKMRLNIIKAEKELIDYQMDVLQHNLDMKDILGKLVVEQDYQDMIDQTDEVADNLRQQLDVLEEQADSLDPTSEAYANVQSEIRSIKKDLLDCEKQQAEWNDKIMRLPIERLDKYIGMLENIKKDLQNWISERDTLNISTLGKTIGEQFKIAQEQIEAYQKREKLYVDLMKNYEYGSEKFEETANEIQSCQDNVSGLIQEMEELNMQFLKLPIDEISKANEKLQQINSAEQRVLDDYDTALSAVLSLFDKQIDKLNDQKDYWDEYYENLIKPEQEKLDLLNEQNEAKQMQYNIDKAQYDLDKARQQKNVQVVRNGRVEYDSDYDAVKNAQDNLANAQHDKVIYDIQQVIDGYEKLNEKKQEELDDEIDAYEDARNRWQTFEDERTFEKESAEALRLFGEGWEKNIINRTDDREYDIFSKGHIELDRQITANEKQIEANETMMNLMTRYAEAFLSGEMTYEDAVAQYNKLYADYQSGGALVSQEALAAELAFNNAKTMSDALNGNNATTKEQYDSFLKQLEEANSNKQIYEAFQKSWDEMKKSLDEQLAELKRLAEAAEQMANQRNKTIGYSHDDDDDGGRGEWSKNPTGYGAGTKYNPNGKGTRYEIGGPSLNGSAGKYFDASDGAFHSYSSGGGGGGDAIKVEAKSVSVESKSTEVKSSSSSSSSGHYNHSSASGPASDPELHADGLAGGIIGNIPPTEKFKKLQAMGLKPLEPDEVPAFLHVGEGVVNAIQQGNILKSVANAYKSGVASNVAVQPTTSGNAYHFDLSFGDITLPDVRDVDGFARSMKMNFESAMNQQFSKIFKN